MGYYQNNMEASIRAFDLYISDKVKDLMGWCEIHPVEAYYKNSPNNRNFRTLKAIDSAGSDYIGVTDRGLIFNLASRVNFNKNYETFTIRFLRPSLEATDWEKYIEAKEAGSTYSQFWSMGFVSSFDKNAELLALRLIRTNALFDYALREVNQDMLKIVEEYKWQMNIHDLWFQHLEPFYNRHRQETVVVRRNPQDGVLFLSIPWRWYEIEKTPMWGWDKGYGYRKINQPR
jgi:hypothetical protein